MAVYLRRTLGVFVLVSFMILAARPALATDDSEIALLHRIPAEALDRIAFDAAPDANGNMQLNKAHWTSVVFQRVAMPLMWIGATESNQGKVDQAWRAVDAAFAHQKPDGSFDTASGDPTAPTDMAFWLEAVSHGIIVLQQSPLAAANRMHISAVLPKIQAAALWLNRPEVSAALLKGDNLGTNRIFTDADAFASAGLLLQNNALMSSAARFTSEALHRITPEGVASEEGGFDSSYQAVSLLHASYLQFRMPDERLKAAIGAMLARELPAIGANGSVDVSKNTRTGRGQEKVYGHAKPVDQRSVILGLYYSGLLMGRTDAVNAARSVFASAFHQSAP